MQRRDVLGLAVAGIPTALAGCLTSDGRETVADCGPAEDTIAEIVERPQDHGLGDGTVIEGRIIEPPTAKEVILDDTTGVAELRPAGNQEFGDSNQEGLCVRASVKYLGEPDGDDADVVLNTFSFDPPE